jgi:hypothetical protein
MRIRELFERKNFKDDDFVSPKEGGREINFDLVDDLIHYMNHDDSVYRRHVFPVIAKCIDMCEQKRKPKPSIFKSAVEECYSKYIKEYPIRELPESIDSETCTEVCDKICEIVCADIKDGKYGD